MKKKWLNIRQQNNSILSNLEHKFIQDRIVKLMEKAGKDGSDIDVIAYSKILLGNNPIKKQHIKLAGKIIKLKKQQKNFESKQNKKQLGLIPEGEELIKINSFIEGFANLSLEDKVKESLNLLDNTTKYFKYILGRCPELKSILGLVSHVMRQKEVDEIDPTIILIKKHI
jgi:hypothetical protein